MVLVSLCLLMSPDEMRGEFWMGATSQEHEILPVEWKILTFRVR